MAAKKKASDKKASKTNTKDEIVSLVKDKFDFALKFLKNKLDEIKAEIRKKITIFLLYLLAAWFILIGVSELVDNFLPMKGIGSLIIGVLLLLIGWIYAMGAKKK